MRQSNLLGNKQAERKRVEEEEEDPFDAYMREIDKEVGKAAPGGKPDGQIKFSKGETLGNLNANGQHKTSRITPQNLKASSHVNRGEKLGADDEPDAMDFYYAKQAQKLSNHAKQSLTNKRNEVYSSSRAYDKDDEGK